MKKQNRISGKADSVESGAQSKTRPKSIVALCQSGGDIADLRAEFGKEVSFFETGLGEEQFLCRSEKGFYALAIEFMEVLDGGEWRRTETMAGAPEEKVRRSLIVLPLTEAQAVSWLDDHIIENLIPEELARYFRKETKRAGEGGEDKSISWRDRLCAVLGLDSGADDDAINAAMSKAVGP